MMDVEKYGMVGLLFVAGILGLVYFYGPDDEAGADLKNVAARSSQGAPAAAQGAPGGPRRAPRPGGGPEVAPRTPQAARAARVPAASGGQRYEMPGIVDGPREPFQFDEGAALDYDGSGAPPRSGRCTYAIRSGDILGEIAARELGSASRVSDLLAWNPGLEARRLQVGQVIRLCPPGVEDPRERPVPAAAQPAAPPSAPPVAAPSAPTDRAKTYTVQKGDVLSVVAQKQLGSIKHTQALFQANRHLLNHPDELKPGMVLTLPRVGDDAGER